MLYRHTVGGTVYRFDDLKTLMAKATPLRSGDVLAGLAASTAQERVAAQMALANLPITTFLEEFVIPYETDEVTRLIVDRHDAIAFQPIRHLTVGGFRDWLLSAAASTEALTALADGLTPEVVAAVSKIMRLQDLILVGSKCRVVTRFRNTIGLEGRLSTRVQPNHPTDDPRGVAASVLDGLLLGGGDAVIGINPATDNVDACIRLLELLDELRVRFDMPTQSCVLTHVTNAMQAMERGAPVDLVFQSIAGSQSANRGFGIDLSLLREAREMALSLKRGSVGNNVMYFETGQGSALSANAHHGVDQQTLEARAYAVAREFHPLLVNTVVGFIGPEYLFNGKQITRAGLEDHFCGKLLGLPMGCDVCYTNHADADQDDMDALLTLLTASGCTFVMGVPGADDIMLNYQSTSFHDALYARRLLGKKPAPEFEAWLQRIGILDSQGEWRSLMGRRQLGGPVTAALGELAGDLAPSASSSLGLDVWGTLRSLTAARIGIAPTGVSQPTETNLAFQWDHALARDAVYSRLAVDTLVEEIGRMAFESIVVHSLASGRDEYLQHPDKGRRVDEASRVRLEASAGKFDIAFVIADGLSAAAANDHALGMVVRAAPVLRDDGWSIAPIVLAEQGRVAIGDDTAQLLGADIVVVMIGERPGLTSADSLGIYLTWKATDKTVDSERNCISNVRPSGLPYDAAASRLLYLIRESRRLCLSGILLKEKTPDPSMASLAHSTSPPARQIP